MRWNSLTLLVLAALGVAAATSALGDDRAQAPPATANSLGTRADDPVAAPAQFERRKPGPRRRGRADGIAGTWWFTRWGSEDTCQVTLENTAAPGRPDAHVAKAGFDFACTRLGLFHLAQWRLVGGEVILVDAFGNPLFRLERRSRRLLRGGGAIMHR